ncbi:DUF4148 domain-containing protein [Paraburkholderia sp. GAS42]|uniref:DUF4148 domain-containing protein n=1 Tax=Paraburkholderia sp. GAS42 TaxID=3035135 RepID=UPI003D1980B7
MLGVPVVSLAQQANAPLTRAQVRAELVQLEQAGYNPANANTVDFPTNSQFAQAPASEQDSGHGPAVSGTSQSGRPTSTSGMKPVFFGQ